MANFFERLLGRNSAGGSSKDAKKRLQFVLLHDRLNLSPERMEAMKREIIAVISKYMTVNEDELDIALVRGDSANKLVAEVPFMRIEGSDRDDEDAVEIATKPKRKGEEAEDDA